jgi:hypothetical protein
MKLKIKLLNILKSIESLLKVLVLSKFRNILATQKRTNKSCIILGNGPSLTQSIQKYKDELAHFDLICVNNFVISDYFVQLKPNFYLLAAPLYFLPDNKISKTYIDIRNTVFQSLKEKTTWELNLMVPFMAKNSSYFHEMCISNKNIKPLYFNQTPVEGNNLLTDFLFRKGLGMPRPHNVLIPAIMNGIYLNYKKIYILGADHSWLPEISVNSKNEALVNQKHFYDENESEPQKMEDYIVRPRKLHEIIHKFYLTFRGYWEIDNFAKKNNIEIYNASETSMIDAFQRKQIKENSEK